MPWHNGAYPRSYKNQPVVIRKKAIEIANELLTNGAEEGVAIATGLKRAREFFANRGKEVSNPELSVANAHHRKERPKRPPQI